MSMENRIGGVIVNVLDSGTVGCVFELRSWVREAFVFVLYWYLLPPYKTRSNKESEQRLFGSESG
jgi:hypothetical protein